MTKRSRTDLWGASPVRAALTRKGDAKKRHACCWCYILIGKNMKYFIVVLLIICSFSANAALETTVYGKIVGLETRAWGMHVQVDFPVGQKAGCPVSPGTMYMLDLSETKVSQTGGNYDFVQSVILASFMAQKEVSFHIYECGSSRPIIGHVRVKH